MISQIAEQIAFQLKNKHSGECSWVEYEKTIYYSIKNNSAKFPGTASTQLIQYLFDRFVDRSFFILRQRIFSTEAKNSFAENMVRLAGKRISFNIEARDHGIEIDAKFIQIVDGDSGLIVSAHLRESPSMFHLNCSPSTAPDILNSLINSIARGPVLHDYNRAISALLTDQNGNILEAATNQNFKNKTLHAELLLIQNYFRRTGKKLPKNTCLYVSLKPCVMCASAIIAYSEAPESLKVYYLNDDPGTKAKNSELEIANLLFKL